MSAAMQGRRRLPRLHPWAMTAKRLLLLAVLLLAWQAASGRLVPSFYISDPLSVARSLGGWIADGTLPAHVGTTLLTLLLGYAIGAVIGIAAGLLLGVMQRTERVLQPFIAALYGIPKVALLPLFIIAFGIGIASKVALVVSVVVFILFYATMSGVRDIDPDIVDAMVLMGATHGEITRNVLIPGALPWVYTGLRTAVGFALTTTVVGEVLTSNSGIGFLIEHSAVQFKAAGVFAAVVVLLVLGLLVNMAIQGSERRDHQRYNKGGNK